MNVITKTLLISLVLSLMPLVSKVAAPDYQGFNLEAAEDDKKKKRKRIKLPSKKAQRILQEVQPLLESESWDEALAMLSVIEIDPKFTGTDIARMLWYYGYIYFSQEKYDKAIRVYKRLIKEPVRVFRAGFFCLPLVELYLECYQNRDRQYRSINNKWHQS